MSKKAIPPRVLLVHAPIEDREPLFRGAPMSILYAASVLAERMRLGVHEGCDATSVQLFDPALNFSGRPLVAMVELERRLANLQPTLVGIGTTSYAYYWACEIARRVKAWNPACVVVVGGPHEDEAGALAPGGSIQDSSGIIDFSIRGDGELLLDALFGELVRCDFDTAVAKAALINEASPVHALPCTGAISFLLAGLPREVGVGRRSRTGPGGGRRATLSLDTMPMPPRHLLEPGHSYLFDIFARPDGQLMKTAQVMTTRGCSYACDFCSERGPVSCRSLDSVLGELRALLADGYEAVFFDDSTFHLYSHRYDLIQELEEHREDYGLEFGCLTRVDRILGDESRLPLSRFAAAGFSYMYFGIEHDDDQVLRAIRKGYSSRAIHECLDLMEHAGLRAGVSVLLGVEGETEESRRRTLRLVAERGAVVLVNLNVLALHPAATVTRRYGRPLHYDAPPPNREPEWDIFEEGHWYHPEHVTLEYARGIHRLICEVDEECGGKLVRKLKRGGCVMPDDEMGSGGWRGRPRRVRPTSASDVG